MVIIFYLLFVCLYLNLVESAANVNTAAVAPDSAGRKLRAGFQKHADVSVRFCQRVVSVAMHAHGTHSVLLLLKGNAACSRMMMMIYIVDFFGLKLNCRASRREST